MGFFNKIMGKIGMKDEEEEVGGEDYVELDTESEAPKSKTVVRPFVLHDFENIKEILDSIRKQNTIAIVNMKPLKDKDLIELKRAINKLKKTTDAVEGEIAGFGEDYLIITPSIATIYRPGSAPQASVVHDGANEPQPRIKEVKDDD